jgi:hypothetical protein
MNMHATLTRSEQRIAQLINIGRPLNEEESEELYRALHADYMRKWRAERARLDKARRELIGCEPERVRVRLLARMREEALQ